ncbi:MAG TPA: hypothetical protein VL523_17715 [Terriglobia bacterium]|nr:hypothetical protein [Terriglobia bacterium]
MTPGEVEKSIQRLDDFATVQGAMSARIERNLDRLEGGLTRLESIVEALAGRLDAIAVKVDMLADNQRVLFEALTGLTQTVDRFIRGQSHNGHGN